MTLEEAEKQIMELQAAKEEADKAVKEQKEMLDKLQEQYKIVSTLNDEMYTRFKQPQETAAAQVDETQKRIEECRTKLSNFIRR